MIFDELPFELKEHVFTHVSPNEWMNTAKVSTEWLELTLRSIKKVEFFHLLILDHLAEFINQRKNTNYTWISFLTLMPRLEHLECIENTEAFWREISPVCHQLKILDLKPRDECSFELNKLNITFNNLTDLLWEGIYQGPAVLFRIFELAPKLEKLTLRCVEINAYWQKRIPKSVKHILLISVMVNHDHLPSFNDLFKNASALETFSAEQCWLSASFGSKFFDETPRLKKLELEFGRSDRTNSTIVKKAFSKCRNMETVKAYGVIISDCWRKVIPENVESLEFLYMDVQENMRRDFLLDSLFQNYGHLQSLELKCVDWTGFDAQKFYSTESLKKLALYNRSSSFAPVIDGPIDPFSDICLRMVRCSHLVDVVLYEPTIDESWRHIFPSTMKRLKLKDVNLSEEAHLIFSPQFLCENPSRIERLILGEFYGNLPAMDLNAFTGMQNLQELNLNLRVSGECLQSILTHCSILTDLAFYKLISNAMTNISRDLVLPSLRKLKVEAPVDQPYLLLQHFPEVRTVDIVTVPPESSFTAIMNALQVVDTVELKLLDLTWHDLRYLVESIEDTKFKYFCLSIVSDEYKEFRFYWTNSVVDACRHLDDIIISGMNGDVLWIKNYPSSLLLRNVRKIPSCMNELFHRYLESTGQSYEAQDMDDEEFYDP